MATSDVPAAARTGRPMTATRSGTATMPPPTPKRALKSPATTPTSRRRSTGRILLRVLDERVALLTSQPRRSAIVLDIDGTLAPIVARPEDATVPEETRAELARLVERYALLACLSGRTGDDARRMVGVD